MLILGDTVAFKTTKLSAVDYRSDLKIKDIKTDFLYCKTAMLLDNLSAYINDSYLGNKIHFDSQADNHYFVKKVRQINAVGGGYIDAPFFGNDGAFLEPTIWLRYLPESKNVTFDLNLRAKVSNSFWAGAGYNLFSNTVNIETGSMLSESIGLDDGQLKIGFGFGIPLGSRWPGLGGIGEVNVSYSWK